MCVYFVDVLLSLLGNHGGLGKGGAGSSRQKCSSQHKLASSNPQESTKWPFSVGYGQEHVLWHLDEKLGLLANCTLENDKPLENAKVLTQIPKK